MKQNKHSHFSEMIGFTLKKVFKKKINKAEKTIYKNGIVQFDGQKEMILEEFVPMVRKYYEIQSKRLFPKFIFPEEYQKTRWSLQWKGEELKFVFEYDSSCSKNA